MHGDVARAAGGRQQFSAKCIRRRPTAALERRPLQRIGEKLPHGFPIGASGTQFRRSLPGTWMFMPVGMICNLCVRKRRWCRCCRCGCGGSIFVETMLWRAAVGCDGLQRGYCQARPGARAGQGVLDAFGHISVRSAKNPNHYFISRSRAPALVSADDIMEYDLEDHPIDARGRASYMERFIHSEIYKARPDVQSVVHSHSAGVIPFGVSDVPLKPISHMSGFLVRAVPVFE